MRCAHIPLNIVPKGVQPSSWNSGKRLTQFCEKDKRGKRGGRRESSLQLKRSALSFKASFREVGLRRSQGQREERPQGRAGMGRSTSRSGPAGSGPASFVYRDAPLWCTSAYLPSHQWSFPVWLPIFQQTQPGSPPP